MVSNSWVERIAITEKRKTILMSLAKNANNLGEGKTSIARIMADTGFTSDQIIKSIDFLKIKQIINVLQTEHSAFIHYQLCMHIPSENFGVVASEEEIWQESER